MELTTAQRDRAVGAVIGMAVGDALGAGYEFQPPQPASEVGMIGGGLGTFEPGEWTDDTSMAIPILDALAEGKDLRDAATQDEVAEKWIAWACEPKDIGNNTASVLRGAEPPTAATIARRAYAAFEAGGRSAGNGSLMRTTPVVLGFLDDPQGLSDASRMYSAMTHGDPQAADACVLWNQAQRHAILTGDFDIDVGLAWIPEQRRDQWRQWIDEATGAQPTDFARHNQWVVGALQEAWAAITCTEALGPEHFEVTLRRVVAAGVDTDTVAAIAGGLLGARWGVSAIPLEWRRKLHGWPDGRTGQALVQEAMSAVTGNPWPDRFYQQPDDEGLAPVALPHDPGVWIGDVYGLTRLPDGVDAVVSLCRLGHLEGPVGRIKAENHVHVWLIDKAARGENPHLRFVADQAARAVAELRAENKQVFLHCVHAHSRTPFIAALYAAHVSGRPPAEVLDELLALLPGADPNPAFREVLGAT